MILWVTIPKFKKKKWSVVQQVNKLIYVIDEFGYDFIKYTVFSNVIKVKLVNLRYDIDKATLTDKLIYEFNRLCDNKKKNIKDSEVTIKKNNYII